MGYSTDYELAHNASADRAMEIEDYIRAKDLEYAVGNDKEACKWYKWKEDMIAMSKNFPEVSFTLEGHGEEYGDIWRASIKDGDIQVKKATIVF